jgi:hypothetical protein
MTALQTALQIPSEPDSIRTRTAPPAVPGPQGGFVEEGGETWYRIDGHDRQPPFFMTLAGDSDLWAFVSSAGSLAAGRGDGRRRLPALRDGGQDPPALGTHRPAHLDPL